MNILIQVKSMMCTLVANGINLTQFVVFYLLRRSSYPQEENEND